ncbi:ParA family protein [Peptoniphilus sp. oral taxon 386]|uniref:ParA family protein n=1 Tax=Peptoniphilus sp. oral taxon 386 TaxID=652713 RepID=UPI0001DAA17A|nr:ParA family protein [Peptoniphilus sp. oral taxon 386]EFI41715.1 hypothetical protein HMPREF0629_00339 [Peptoniphilus sp. oral taxon 386 str. F0131]
MYITFFNDKGGVGCSTIVRELSLYFTRINRKVLIIDLDNKGTITKSLGVDSVKTVKDLVEGSSALECITNTKYVDLISYDKNFLPSENTLRSYLGEIEGLYDYIFIDSDASNAEYAIKASRYVVIPTTCDLYSYFSLEDTLNKIQEHGKRMRILLNKVSDSDICVDITNRILELSEKKSIKIFDTAIRDDETILEIQYKNKELRSFDTVSDAAEDFLMLVDEIDSL